MNIYPLSFGNNHPLLDDYLRGSDKVKEFYPFGFVDDWEAAIQSRKEIGTPRREICRLLCQQNKAWGAGCETLRNVELLSDHKTFAIVTGQQAGVLGGPLYTFYKVYTTLKLVKQLQERFRDYQFVPLFWLEINDSDFKEISQLSYISKENQLRQLTIPENETERGKPIAFREVDERIHEWREHLEEDFFDTEFKEEVIQLFLEAYIKGQNYADAFAVLLLKIFGKYGLVVLNPAADVVGKLAAPLFKKALCHTGEIIENLSERSAALSEAGYLPQIQFRPNQTLLFYHDQEQKRLRVDTHQDQAFLLSAGERKQPIKKEDLLASCEEAPERFSPNVALRPVMQDFLLPTLAYIAGPSEIAYFAQVEVLYRFFNIPMPVIVPRHRLTIVEGKIQKLVQKHHLEYETILQQKVNVVEKARQEIASHQLLSNVNAVGEKIDVQLEQLQSALEGVDPTLINSLKKTQQGIWKNLNRFNAKIVRSLELQQKNQLQQIERIMLYLLPENRFQERVFSMLYLCIKYGPDIIDKLYEILPDESEKPFVCLLD